MTQINNHEELFQIFIVKLKAIKNSTREDGANIIDGIKKIYNRETVDQKLKKRIKNRKFSVIDEKLYCDKIKVVYMEEIYDVLNNVHSIEGGHPGVVKTFNDLKEN